MQKKSWELNELGAAPISPHAHLHPPISRVRTPTFGGPICAVGLPRGLIFFFLEFTWKKKRLCRLLIALVQRSLRGARRAAWPPRRGGGGALARPCARPPPGDGLLLPERGCLPPCLALARTKSARLPSRRPRCTPTWKRLASSRAPSPPPGCRTTHPGTSGRCVKGHEGEQRRGASTLGLDAGASRLFATRAARRARAGRRRRPHGCGEAARRGVRWRVRGAREQPGQTGQRTARQNKLRRGTSIPPPLPWASRAWCGLWRRLGACSPAG